MARIRSIKPEFFSSLSIADLSRDARLLFIGLWTYVDDDGRGIADPRLIKAHVFPLDDDLPAPRVAELIDELLAKGRVRRYDVTDRTFLVVVNFSEHQRINRHIPSRLPAPPSDDETPGQSHDVSAHDSLTEDAVNPHVLSSEDSPPDLRIMDHGSMDHGKDHARRGVSECARSEPALIESPAPPAVREPEGFEDFWRVYPRRTGKGSARKAWVQARKRATFDQILIGADRFAAALAKAHTEERFVPHPATWLNADRWSDESLPASNGVPGPRVNAGTAAVMRAMERRGLT
jgi:hypothetical protein